MSIEKLRNQIDGQAERRPGRTRLVYDKTKRAIVAVPSTAIRIAALESQLAEANERAERNIGVLKQQLANCHETMRKDGIRHAKLLLAVEDDAAEIARLRATLAAIHERARLGGGVKGKRERINMPNDLLNAPCIFCGYSGANYYRANTHDAGCPWREVGGPVERESALRGIIECALADRDAALTTIVALESQLAEANERAEANYHRMPRRGELGAAIQRAEAAEARESRLREALDNALAAWAADMDGADRIGAIFQNIYQEGLAAIADAEQPAESEEAK